MSGWTPEYAQQVKAAFYEHLDQTWIKSKELGYVILGEHLLDGQTRVIETIFEGLGRDIHEFKILKSRQLGISTIVRALGLFWNGFFEITSALVFDTGPHLDEARMELIDMLEKFPESYKFPRKKRDNRYSLALNNGSRFGLLSAGVQKTKGGGGLGAGSAIVMAHRSELCGYGNAEALESFRHSLARQNPNRLFIDESTARGYNLWHEIWEEGKADPHCICIFIGWWSHDMQKIDRDDPEFVLYTDEPLSDEEKRKIREVKERYGHEITAEQLAWIRRELTPASNDNQDEAKDYSGDPLRLQNQPWTEEDAFQQTGSTFFAPESLTDQTNRWASSKYKAYMFACGFDFHDMRVYPTKSPKQFELKVWEEPVPDSCYIISADPAYGRSAKSDRSALQVLRCYSDGLDQVAEYAWQGINSQQLAWVIVALEAWYSADNSQIYRIVEINGPGDATWRELLSMKQKIATGYFTNQGFEGLQDIQRNVRNYFYTRADTLHSGSALHLKTTEMLKVSMMERLRDHIGTGMLHIRSHATIDEMRSITRDGDNIEAEGSKKDDRVTSLAFGVRMWDDRVRRMLMQGRRTREAEQAKRRRSLVDQVKLYNESQFQQFLALKQRGRNDLAMASMRGQRWGGRR
jgi:hypothetical protein